MIKVLIIDDSFFIRKMLNEMLSSDGEIHVVGEACNGAEGLQKIAQLNPDVVCLDIVMPRSDGVWILEQIMKQHPTPVIIFSSLSGSLSSEISKDVFKLGVTDVVKKPDSPEALLSIRDELIRKIKTAAQIDKNKLGLIYGSAVRGDVVESRATFSTHIVSLGCPVNQPVPLEEFLSFIPENFAAGIIAHQHMPHELAALWVEHVQQTIHLEVKVAEEGDLVIPGRVLLSPKDKVIELNRLQRGGVIQLRDYEHINKAHIDTMFESAAKSYRDRALAVLLAGTGNDGVEGLKATKLRGGRTFVEQNPTIHPRIAEETLADNILPIAHIAREIVRLVVS